MKRAPIRSRPVENNLSAEEWALVLAWLLMRSGETCEMCGGSLTGVLRELVEIQHRRARGMGGTSLPDTHLMSNLLVLHGACHHWIERHERGEALVRGLRILHETDEGGDPIPASEYPLVLHSGRRVLLHPTEPIYLRHPDEWGVRELAARRAVGEEPMGLAVFRVAEGYFRGVAPQPR